MLKISSFSSFILFVFLSSLFINYCTLTQFTQDHIDSCRDSGFITEQLLCNSCELFSEKIKNKELVDKCFNCCINSKNNHNNINQEKKAVEAVIFFCPYQIERYQHIFNFINDKVGDYENVRLHEVQGMYVPKLKLLDENKTVIQTVNLDRWKTEEVIEFLDENNIN